MSSALRVGTTLVSVVALIAVNVIPLVGVAFWGWSLMMILVLYWIESGIVGVINVFKIRRAQGGADEPPVTVTGNRVTIRISGRVASGMTGAPLIAFFILHYGIFWAVHGVFIFLMPLFAGASNVEVAPDGSVGFAPMDFGPLPLDGLLLAAGLLAASHVVSYFTNYIGGGEYRRVTPAGQMLSVYGRVVVLHVTIILGAVVIAAFGTPIAALVLLVVLKTILDLVLHVASHRSVAAAPARDGGSASISAR